MKTFSTNGTGSQQTLSEIESDKMPVYNSMADAEADLANLKEGQLVAIEDTGDELAQPVDTVQAGNLHAVTSNAVAEALSYSTSEVNTGKKWIDGKPIYRKSGYVSSISSVPYIVDSVLTDTYVDVLIESKASMKYYSAKLVVYGYSSSTDRFSLRATSSGLELVTNFSLGDISNGFYWTVEYTKTTD
jgi:hypothetical protein